MLTSRSLLALPLATGAQAGGGLAAGEADTAPACCCDAAAERDEDTAGRHKLWELEPGSHCSIIGTCLGLDELRRILRKAAIAMPPNAQDYDIHGYFVTQSGSRSVLAKLVHKALDRKYATPLARFHRSRTPDELWELWRQAMMSGEVAGAYWALMTQKAATRMMRIRAHNEIHMLSHLLGKSSRDDIRRSHQLEAACAELTEQLAKTRARAEAVLQERDTRLRALEAQCAAAAPKADAEPQADLSGTLRRRDRQLDRLRARFATAERRLRAERARARAAEDRLAASRQAPDGAAKQAAPDGAERRAPPDGAEPPGDVQPRGEGAGGDLQGCALLYVGGYREVTPRLRAHVEGMRGTFLYHDGGIEQQNVRLPGLVSQADAVFCPVGCVSHDACLRLKHLCKRHGKRFVLLRSAGLSGFVSAVSAMTRPAPAASPSRTAAEVGHGGD